MTRPVPTETREEASESFADRPPDRDALGVWLGALSRADFLRDFAGRRPLARPGSALDRIEALGWPMLARVLAAREPPADVLVVAGGRLVPLPPPSGLERLRGYFANGVGLCLRGAERCDDGLAAIADSFAKLGRVQVQLFATPPRTWGFGWHFDEEDVFIAQTAGVKEYFFRENTVTDEPPSAEAFRGLAAETSPIYGATLAPGDVLYVPRRWWHRARGREPALSISVGVRIGAGGSESLA